jgi:cytokinin riboside 5'-monophosphate phosphoribohydrolase
LVEQERKLHIAVYCASSNTVPEVYFEAARELGRLMARQSAVLVYGGGSVGLMGAISNAMLESGAEVVGVIPYALQQREVGNDAVTELIITNSMRERKAIMEEKADAFITLPGGFGTLEEIFEIVTGRQLGYHAKPLVILNTAGFYDHLLEHLALSAQQNFLKQNHLDLLYVVNTPQEALDYINQYHPPTLEDKFKE